MDVGEFCGLITGMEEKIISTIETGAQWEVWLQVELFKALIRDFGVGAREVRLGGGKPVDLAFSHKTKIHLVELKVESAHHAGQFAGVSLSNATDTDADKLANVPSHADFKWVCAVAWSPNGKEQLRDYGFDYTQFGDTIHVAIKKC